MLIALIIAAVCFVVAFLAGYWIRGFRQYTRNSQYELLLERAQAGLQAQNEKHQQERNETNVQVARLERLVAELQQELKETHSTLGIWQYQVKRLEEQFEEANAEFIKLLQERDALARGNQELQLQLDAAPKEPMPALSELPDAPLGPLESPRDRRRPSRKPKGAAQYNAEMDARLRQQLDAREKPWLPPTGEEL